MPSRVKPIPEGHHTVTPYLAIKNAAEALEFYKRAFGAIESYKLMMPDGRVGHAEIRLGDSLVIWRTSSRSTAERPRRPSAGRR